MRDHGAGTTGAVEKGKPRLLFLSPITPQRTGNGLAMRGGAMLDVLSQDYTIFLLVIPISGSPDDVLPTELAEKCAEVQQLPQRALGNHSTRACHHPSLHQFLGWLHPYPQEWKAVTTKTLQRAFDSFAGRSFDHIHIFRTYLCPFAEPFLADQGHDRPLIHLDMDDVESMTRQRLADAAQGRIEQKRLRQEAEFFEGLERECFETCDDIYVCSEKDRQLLQGRFPDQEKCSALANTVQLPRTTRRDAPGEPFSFLFIGNLNYFPNRDGLDWFSDEVLPLLRKIASRSFKVSIVGSCRAPHERRLSKIPEFDVKGFVPQLQAMYDTIDASLVPVRVGGGTRIKVLESMAHRRPVIATTAAAEGLELKHDEEVLLADRAEDFARACTRIMEDPLLRERLIERSFEKVSSCYSPEVLLGKLRRTMKTRVTP